MVKDTGQILQTLLVDWDKLITDFKVRMGILLERKIKQIFDTDGQDAPENTDPLNAGGVNEAWKPHSPITIKLAQQQGKGKISLLRDQGFLRDFVKFIIEDMEVTDSETGKKYDDVVKVGWFEDSGGYNDGTRYLSTPHLAAIHEFGLTGKFYNTPDGIVMGGVKISVDPAKTEKVRKWLASKGIHIKKGTRIEIPTRSMLRKAADLVALKLDQLFITFINAYLQNISNKP